MVVETKRPPAKGQRIDLDSPEPLRTINWSACARELGLNVSSVSRILRDERTPSLHTFYALAQYLGVSLDKLYKLLYPTPPTRRSKRGRTTSSA